MLHPSWAAKAVSRSARGVSLIELMVAMAIGLVVIGAVFTNYLSNSVSGRQTAAMSQVTSDAAIALGILRNHIAMAGYSAPTESSATGLVSQLTGPAIIGCDDGFANINEADVVKVTCADAPEPPPAPTETEGTEGEPSEPPAPAATTVSPGNSLLVRYVTDTRISPGTAASLPTDCVGNGIAATGSLFVADSRFELSPPVTPQGSPAIPSLDCRGNGTGTSATAAGSRAELVENVVEMHLRYGLGEIDTSTTGKLLGVQRYVPASEVATPTGASAAAWEDAWRRVLAVRVCIVVRSTEQVLSAPTPYMGCDQAVKTPADRHIYRAFTSTVLVNNRLSAKSLQ